MKRNVGEGWECGNCYQIGKLDTHGRCGRCGSDAVVSQELLELTGPSGMRTLAGVQRVRAIRMGKRVQRDMDRLFGGRKA